MPPDACYFFLSPAIPPTPVVKGGGRAPHTLTWLGWIYHHDVMYARKWPLPVYLCFLVCGSHPPFISVCLLDRNFPRFFRTTGSFFFGFLPRSRRGKFFSVWRGGAGISWMKEPKVKRVCSFCLAKEAWRARGLTPPAFRQGTGF